MSRVNLILLALALAAGPAAVAQGGAPSAAGKRFAADPRFRDRITVRMTAMRLDEALAHLERTLGIPLRAASEIADQKVSIFAEDLPAGRILDALTAMLNMAPEGGFSWETTGRGPRRGFTLLRSARAQAQARERLATEQESMAARLRQGLREVARNEEARRRALSPVPDGSFRRAAYLASQLTDAQMERLNREGSLVLRAAEIPLGQNRILALMGGDAARAIEPDLTTAAEDDPLRRVVGEMDPSRFALTIEVQRVGTSMTLFGYLRTAPDRPGIGLPVFLAEPEVDPGAAAAPAPAGTEPPLRLRPRTWSMGDVLSEVARRSGQPLVSDCYWLYWFEVQAVSNAPLAAVLARIDQAHRFRHERRDGFLLLRSRHPALRQAQEISPALLQEWTARVEREGVVSLDLLAGLPELQAGQIAALRERDEMKSPGAQAVADALYLAALDMRSVVRLYAALSPAQRRQVSEGGARLPFAELTPAQQSACLRWLRVRAPHTPEADYAGTVLLLRSLPGAKVEMTWEARGVHQSREFFLDLQRVGIYGNARPALPGQADPVGQPAPKIEVTTLDGRPVTLEGPGRVLFFRPRWAVPCVGRGAGVEDLTALADLLAARPDLVPRAAVVVPDVDPEELRAWTAGTGLKAPIYADPEGKAAQRFNAGSRPRVVQIGADGRIARLVDGCDAVSRIEWRTWLRPVGG